MYEFGPNPSSPGPRIVVSTGPIDGVTDPKSGVSAFLGLRYGAPPIGRHRFAPPSPPDGHTEAYDAKRFRARCSQRAPFRDSVFRSSEESEDCLFLNVWTPAACCGGSQLPILIIIHGGAFLVGDGSEPRHDGAAIAARGIITVTLNFRLGILGFFSHPEMPTVNLGLLDICAAIDWVRENASAFGGDPTQLTLLGTSSGGVAALALAVSPKISPQVSRVVLQSPAMLTSQLEGALAPLDDRQTADARGLQSAARARRPRLSDLRELSTIELIGNFAATAWNRPVVDGELVAAQLLEAIANPAGGPKAILTGMTSAERGFERAPSDTATVKGFMQMLQAEYSGHAPMIFQLYGAPQTEQEVLRALHSLEGDRWIGRDLMRIASHAAATDRTVFAYRFDRSRPPPRRLDYGWNCENGAAHSTDIEYFSGTLEVADAYLWTEEDRALSAQMLDYLCNFVRSGDPNGSSLTLWPSVRSGRQIIFDSTVRQDSLEPLLNRLALLNR